MTGSVPALVPSGDVATAVDSVASAGERLDLVGRRRVGLRAASGQGDDDQADRRGDDHDDRDSCLTVAFRDTGIRRLVRCGFL